MPGITRLNKAAKQFNISIARAVKYLTSVGIDVENNPNAQLDQIAYSALEAQFQQDGAQKKASSEVVIAKVPETKLTIEEPKPIEIIRAKAPVSVSGTTVLGKMNLDTKPAISTPEVVKEEPQEPSDKEVVAQEQSTKIQEKVIEEKVIEESVPDKPKSPDLVILDKIDLSLLEKKTKPKELKKDKPELKKPTLQDKTPKVEIVPAKLEQAPIINVPPVQVQEETEKIETVYQKLDGPKIMDQKIDLSQFESKPKTFESKKEKNKKKRKRIPGSPTLGVAIPQSPVVNDGPKKVLIKKEDRPSEVNNNVRKRGATGGGSRRNADRVMPVELTEEQVKNQIKETLEKLTNKGNKSKSSKFRKEKRVLRREQDDAQNAFDEADKTLRVTEFITVSDLASLMDVAATDVISVCFSLGVMVTMNQRLEADTLTLVADEFGFNIEFSDADIEDTTTEELADEEEDLLKRAPVVTVMGHVDHGKTSLLDYIRKTNVIAGESGGITQHIGAYNVKLENGEHITFLDTPGHEAFTAMRARGAQVTDIAIIVVAADDDVMPQTKEAISHAQAAGVPMIIAINKVDKPNANPNKIREQLSVLNVLVEDWGGSVQCQEVSAKFGDNVEVLLEKVLLQAEMLMLKANPNRVSNGVVIEAALDKGRGYISTVLVQNGTLQIGDYVLAGKNHGKVKALLDERGKPLTKAGPSTPVTILGLDGAPTAGDKFKVFKDEKEAKNIANKREQLQREQTIRTKKHLTLDEIGRRIALGDFKELNIILKGDVDGSVEALSDMLQQLSTPEIHINILLKGVGQITESDVLLATASDAIIIGFNVRPGGNAKELAEKEEIEIRHYSIIYDAIDEVKEAMEGMLSPEIKEQVIGSVEIRLVYKISKVGSIAGCMVLSGKVARNAKVRLIRQGIVQFDGELESLKRFKDDVKEVTKGYECGLNLKGYNDIEEYDLLEVYEQVSVKKKLK